MSIRSVKNFTTKHTTRSVRSYLTDQTDYVSNAAVARLEDNPNINSYTAAPTIYHGYDHLPQGTPQYSAT